MIEIAFVFHVGRAFEQLGEVALRADDREALNQRFPGDKPGSWQLMVHAPSVDEVGQI